MHRGKGQRDSGGGRESHTTSGRKSDKRDKPRHSNKLINVHKKNGGGAFNWGAPGQIFDDEDYAMDRGDPCWDSEEEDGSYVLVSQRDEEIEAARRMGLRSPSSVAAKGISFSSARPTSYASGSPPRFGYDPKMGRRETPVMDLASFKRKAESILSEYFFSDDIGEVKRRLKAARCPVFHFEFVKRAVTMSMDRDSRTRESISRLLSELYPLTISTNQIGKGFERIFEQIEELVKDCPSASSIVVKFLCRAAIDEILPPSFFTDPHVVALGGSVLDDARAALSCAHKSSRLERVWGPGDGRNVRELKIAIDQIVGEYLENGGIVDEATACVRELEAPYFHHEFVKRAMFMSMDRSSEARGLVSKLFRHLFRDEIVSRRQFRLGFQSARERLDDVTLDVPTAPLMFKEFVEKGAKDGYYGAGMSDRVSAAAKASAKRAATSGGV